FEYSPETTTVKTSGNDDAYGTADDLHTHYVFDDQGRTVSAYTTNLGKTEVYGASNAEYSPTVQGSKKNDTIIKDSVSGVPAVNLLSHSSFEAATGWSIIKSGTGYSSVYTSTAAFIGTRSCKLNSTNGGSGFSEMRQTYTVTEAGTYTLSAYVKLSLSAVTTGFYLELGGVSSRKLKTNTNTTIQNGWQRISVTADLAAGTHEVRAILQNATGTAYVDCIQLEKADGASSYNLLNNGSFTGSTSGWTTSGASYASGRIKLTGSPTATKTAYQTVSVNLPLTTTFVLSGWAESHSVAITDSDRAFGMKATLIYSDNSTEETWVNFCAENAAWQFASGAVVNKAKTGNLTISSVKIELHYDYNANTAYFDNICLAMEPAQTYLYDSEGNLTSATNAEGNKIGAEYSADGVDITSYTNIVGEKFTYSYHQDMDHVLTGIIKTDGHGSYLTTSYEYDSYGNVSKESISGIKNGATTGNITTETYHDSYGRVLSVIDSLGHTTSYNRDSATELLNYVQNANGARTHYDYDGKDRLTAIFNDVDKDGVKDTTEENVVYTYNTQNQLTSINNGSTTYTFTYNGFGNVTSIKAGSYTLASYTYNSKNGKLVSTSYGNGFTVTNVYDQLDRLVQVKYNNVVAYTVSYNGDGSVAKVVDDRSGITTEYEYDSLGRLIHATEYETASKTAVLGTENRYDSYGRPVGSEYALPGIQITYGVTYKENSNLVSGFSQHNKTDYNLNGKYYTYDALERLTGVRTYANGLTVYEESYTYVPKSTRTSSLVATHTVDGVTYSYTYDNLGNITSVSENGTLRANYYYDSLGQLREVSYYSDLYYSDNYFDSYEYNYDKSGNITNVSHYYGPDAIYWEDNTYSYSNTAWGDLLTNYNGTAITYDAVGNPTKWRNANHLAWLGRNLSAFQYADGSCNAYLYNADGIRTSKYYYDADG
ncbi:MAG: RHS repeat protein, partial [Clostridia bacterium]|nr:RHS repeat protein [Clostridia bacterium]